MTEPYYSDDQVTLHLGDALTVARELPSGAADCIVTSPPYFGLRDYGTEGQYGLESSPAEYVERMRVLFAELRRVLADDGTLWLNIGDSYASGPIGQQNGICGLGRPKSGAKSAHRPQSDVPPKNLLGIPWRTAFALQDDGWILRNAIIWNKPNAMPESVTDRLSGRYEHVFLFSKSRRYWFDLDPIREPSIPQKPRPIGTRNKTPRHTSAADNTGWKDHLVTNCPDGRNPGDYWEIPLDDLAERPSTITTDEAIYMAAFIDGEGSICIRRRKTQIQLILTVVNTHEGVIRWLHERTGMGQIKQREIRNEKWRQVWEWSVTSRQAAQVIFAVYPHLRVKQQQAAVALHFMATTRESGGGRATPEYHEARHAMAEDVAALNAGRIVRSRFAYEPRKPRTSSAGDVFVLPTQPFSAAHFAVYPVALPQRCILAGCKPGGTVLDPFSGSGTTGLAAQRTGRKYIGIDINREYLELSLNTRLREAALDFGSGA